MRSVTPAHRTGRTRLVRSATILAAVAGLVAGGFAAASSSAVTGSAQHTVHRATTGRVALAAAVRNGKVVQSAPRAGAIAPQQPCTSLTSDDLTGVPGAPATIIGTKAIDAASNPLGSYSACQITGIIAPQTQFTMDLPDTTYTGRYLQLGCGGNCGTDVLGSPAASYNCTPVTSGQFAEATDNEGHVGTGFGSEFAEDQDLRTVFGYKSEHQMALVAKQILADYYGARPSYSYFDGCSEGGHEGLTEAQRFPKDFNGIIAGAPAAVWNELEIFYQGWNELANTGANEQPILTLADLAPLHAAVVAACDPLDGTTDGIIADPLGCHWQPSQIACAAGQVSSTTDFCLTAAQVTTVDKLYSGPRTASGKLLYPGWQLRGSELNWAAWLVPFAGDETSTIDYGIVNPWLKYGVYPAVQPGKSDKNLQFTAASFKTLTRYDSFFDATDPDLSAFRADGGKLIMWHGLADPAISPVGSIAYYNAVQRELGYGATHSFSRLFMLPGVSHCGGGDGPDSFDGLGALTDWVEDGTAPDSLTTYKVTNGTVTASRPVYQYPKIAVDTTGGPTTEASSYTAQNPPTTFDSRSIPYLGRFEPGYEKVGGWVDGEWVVRSGRTGLFPN